DRLKRIQHRLNERPRKKLDFNTPKVEFYKQLM
ncbi:MAG: IS30 family transposase, partial [Petrimonas mucosa]